MDKTDVISVKNLDFAYESHESILRDLSFSIPDKSICALVGPNGSGKTTLLKIFLGLLTPQKGEVLVLGKMPFAARGEVAYVPQRFSFDRSFPITVFEFLHFSHPSFPREEIKKYLDHLNIGEMVDTKLGYLSGGQMQRVLVVRAILGSPKIIFMDEPAAGIDIGGEQNFYELILHLHNEHQSTIVMVSHELDIVANFANFVLCLNKKLVCYGKPEKVLTLQTLQDLYGKEATVYRHKEK